MIYQFFICLFILAVRPKVTFEKGLQATQITLTDIHAFSEVLVEAEFNYVDNDRYEKVHLAVRALNKHKKQAYIDLLKKYNGVVRMLIKIKAIPNKQSMIQSIVHRNFYKKSRKWEFSRYFVIYALKQDVPRILQKLQVFKPELIKSGPIIHYLDEKYISIAAFIEAKLELQSFIKKHLNSEYRILLTKDIEIIGDKIKNQQIIEDHIERQFNQATQLESESDINKNEKQIEGYYSKQGLQKVPKRIIMKVLFQLAEKNADMEDILDQIEQGQIESHSISDFEAEMAEENWKEQSEIDEQDEQTNSKYTKDEL